MSFFDELRRRNVIRMAGLYLVGAWLITEVAATVLPLFGAPDWVTRSVIVVLVIGFIPALVLTWVFELTPGGLKHDADVPAGQSTAPQTVQRMNRTIIAMLVLAVVYFGFDKFVLEPQRDGVQVESAQGATNKTEAVAKEAAVIGPGVAVLPFANMSPDPDNAFFAGGVFEEVLTKLSKVPELRVISRTSMERIAKENLAVSTIGKRLGVSHVLEGSVRRAGDRVRVTVQLIEASTDNHVWAENYDRTLDDAFAIQSEIALAIAEQLKITLSKQLQSSLSARATKSQVAYDLYLRAVEETKVWRGAATFRAMIALLEPAVKEDPDFLDAQVKLADAYGRMYWLGEDPDNQYVSKARVLIGHINTRWPGRPESLLAQAQLLYNVDHNYAAALQKFEAAQVPLPGDIAVASGISFSLKRLARYKPFLVAARRWQSLDPESPAVNGELMLALQYNQLHDEAIAVGEAATRRFPEDETIARLLATLKLKYRGEIDPILAYGRRFPSNGSDWLVVARFAKGDVDGALAVLAAINSDNPLAKAAIDARQAALLRLAGRDAEAQPLAARAFSTTRAALAADQTALQGREAAGYGFAAAIAALAGEQDSAAVWQRKALAAPVSSLEEQSMRDSSLADMHQLLGNPEAAWRLISQPVDPANRITDHQLLALRPYFDKRYGQSPSYRAHMAKIARQP